MSQLVEKARGQLREAVSAALAQAVEAGELPQAQPPPAPGPAEASQPQPLPPHHLGLGPWVSAHSPSSV